MGGNLKKFQKNSPKHYLDTSHNCNIDIITDTMQTFGKRQTDSGNHREYTLTLYLDQAIVCRVGLGSTEKVHHNNIISWNDN